MLDPRLAQLAHNIREFIAESSYNLSEVARAVGVDRSTVQRWTTGGRTPTMENLIKLSDLLDRAVTDFWRGPHAIPATPEQRLMVEYMAHMTPAQQESFLAFAASMTVPALPKPER